MDAVEAQTVQRQTVQPQTARPETGGRPISSQVPDSAALVRSRATLGDFELTVCTDGTYLLDGGAMFGVVPKTLWQKRIPADGENRILLGLNSLVVRTGGNPVRI